MSSKLDKTCFDWLQPYIVSYFGEWQEISSQLPYYLMNEIVTKENIWCLSTLKFIKRMLVVNVN